jgi:hypothetical protein
MPCVCVCVSVYVQWRVNDRQQAELDVRLVKTVLSASAVQMPATQGRLHRHVGSAK